jgi:crotonobetaine/carnitine-CoA ligase
MPVLTRHFTQIETILIDISRYSTIGDAFFEAVRSYGSSALLAVPKNPSRVYLPDGLELTYAQAAEQVQYLISVYSQAGYGVGHRVGLSLENRPEHILHKLALNSLGVCCVPLNPDYRPQELAYIISHSRVDVIISLRTHLKNIIDAVGRHASMPSIVCVESFAQELSPPKILKEHVKPNSDTPASILYTSGTTGKPKGCVLSHRYELAAGAWYANTGGLADIQENQERLFNPLPLYHVNASVLSFYCMLLTGNCQIQTDRFQPKRWWEEIVASRATIVHYLGVIIPMLLNQPSVPREREHRIRFGFGAGVESTLHQTFEDRFGFPLVEIWGMTEMVRTLSVSSSPRQVGSRAFGKQAPGLEVRVVDDQGRDVLEDHPGEMLIRHSAEEPRKDFFSSYLDDPEATERAWRGGWFHTGDVVTRDSSGMLHFVDRNKHIIRRSGENISAAEVEAILQAHPLVKMVAVLGVTDEVREQEVLACVCLSEHARTIMNDWSAEERQKIAISLFKHCSEHLAYYKAPGWILLVDDLPTTGTQKIQKHMIFDNSLDPRSVKEICDLRHLKKREYRENPYRLNYLNDVR